VLRGGGATQPAKGTQGVCRPCEGVVVNGRLNRTAEGVLQGGPLSPMLSNLLLDDLDKEFDKRGHRFACYADVSFESPICRFVIKEETTR
jgi:retron-type reverse transcriptase